MSVEGLILKIVEHISMLIGHPKNEKGIPLDGIDSIPVGTIVMFAGLASSIKKKPIITGNYKWK